MAANHSAFAGLAVLTALSDSFAHDSSPRSYSDVTTPRTWSAAPSRATSAEPAIVEQPDVVDVRCADRDCEEPNAQTMHVEGICMSLLACTGSAMVFIPKLEALV